MLDKKAGFKPALILFSYLKRDKTRKKATALYPFILLAELPLPDHLPLQFY